MNASVSHVSAPPGQIYWRTEVCPYPRAKVLLRTIGGVATIGQWQGGLNESFTAWSPLPTSAYPIHRAPLKERLQFAFNLIFKPDAL